MRDTIYDIISKMDPCDEMEQQHQSFVLNWIKSGSEIFRLQEPAVPPVHLVAYFIPYDERADKVLLVDHKKAKLWLPPGGHVELNEHPKDTVIREMQEELAAEAVFVEEKPIFLTARETQNDLHPHTDVSLWYLLRGDSRQQYQFDENEFHQIKWFDVEQVPFEKSDPHLNRFFKKINH